MAVILFGTMFLFPIAHELKGLGYLYTYIHELGHALAIWASMGEVTSFEVFQNNTGAVFYTDVHTSFFPIIAGYFTSLIISLLIIYLSIFSKNFSIWLVGLAMLLFAPYFLLKSFTLALFWIFSTFFFTFALANRGAQFLGGLIIGVIGVADSLGTIWYNLVQINYLRSDAFFISNVYGGEPQHWGTVWFISSVLCVLYAYIQIYKELLDNERKEKPRKRAKASTSKSQQRLRGV